MNTSPTTQTSDCFFCSNPTLGHQHYTVLVYENGKCLGRVGSGGYIVNRKVFALILGKERADAIAAEITSEGQFTTKVKPF